MFSNKKKKKKKTVVPWVIVPMADVSGTKLTYHSLLSGGGGGGGGGGGNVACRFKEMTMSTVVILDIFLSILK